MKITKSKFGELQGANVDLYTLRNSSGFEVEITNYGGTIVAIRVPDRSGNIADVTLGYATFEGYLTGDAYFGALIGRHANRIEDGRFSLNDQEFILAKNDGKNHLHGGLRGFDKAIWSGQVIECAGQSALRLCYESKDGEENYPGNLQVEVIYYVTEDNSLGIKYRAVADQDTVVNLTNHAYFNLAGHGAGEILGHDVWINADKFTPINGEGIPNGEISDVRGTPLDFTSPKTIGQGLASDHEQIRCGRGFDHNWVLNNKQGELGVAAKVSEPVSGRVLHVYTTKPGIQFYTGNFLDGSDIGKGGVIYLSRSGFCLETQYFPNALTHRHFPSPILRKGEHYEHETIYKFSTT